MNEEKKTVKQYDPPRVEVIEVSVEHGFAVSDVTVSGWGNGGSLGGGEAEEF
ncbi:MAG: hypothetical protein IJB28_09085 [Bacteroidaceae bacterium]|nr:hypothetical protein [Bacteroidaceae bacterium]